MDIKETGLNGVEWTYLDQETDKWWWALVNTIMQGVYKRMVRFQKLTRNLFLTLHGQNVRRQQRQLSKFLMR